VGQTPGAGGGRVSAGVSQLRWRHPIDRIHHGAGADPEDPDLSQQTARAAAAHARHSRSTHQASNR
jgi:hypothetical protein